MNKNRQEITRKNPHFRVVGVFPAQEHFFLAGVLAIGQKLKYVKITVELWHCAKIMDFSSWFHRDSALKR